VKKPSEQIGAIIDKFYRKFRCDADSSSISIRDYEIDQVRSFQLIVAQKGSLEITLAGILFDYNETVIREYFSPGEVMEYEDDRDESEKDKFLM
jgi:hypothetical protein